MIRHYRFVFFCARVSLRAALCFFPLPVLAQATVIDPPGLSASSVLQMLFGLAVILGLFFSGAYMIRKLNGGKNFGHIGPLKILGGLMIGPRERIVLVEINDSWLIIGIVPGQIKTLYTLPKGEFPETGDDEKPFALWLKQFTGKAHEKQ